MSTTTKIDLSKCKVGTRLMLRNGDETKLRQFDKSASLYTVKADNEYWYCNNGACYAGSVNPRDIVAILPNNPKAAKKKAQPDQLAKIRRLLADFKAGRDVFSKEIKRLEGLLK